MPVTGHNTCAALGGWVWVWASEHVGGCVRAVAGGSGKEEGAHPSANAPRKCQGVHPSAHSGDSRLALVVQRVCFVCISFWDHLRLRLWGEVVDTNLILVHKKNIE